MARCLHVIALLVALLACAVTAAAQTGARRSAAFLEATPVTPVVRGAPAVGPQIAFAIERAAVRQAVVQRRRREAARRVELRRLKQSRSVHGALRRAWLARAIDAATHRRARATWLAASRDLSRLTGPRRAELGAVMTMIARLASARRLTASRLEPVFLTLRRNREFWTRRALPRPAERFTFGGDPVVFQYYAGRGLAIQPLASFGTANALAKSCLERGTRFRCRPVALRRLLDRMVALGAERAGFLAWEHYFAFGRGSAGWISGMTQATGAQALARGRLVLGDARYGRAARRALGAFESAPPTGVAVSARRGQRYAMYSFSPDLRILNGELQAVIGLRDAATMAPSRRARRLYLRGERVARAAVSGFDTGAWSLYSARGAESSLNYHRLVGDFLDGLCERTRKAAYCATGRRFARYEREPPRLHLKRLRRLRARRPTAITFSLSKVSHVSLAVWDRGGLELQRTLRLTRGRHSVSWVPARRGRHRLRIVAVGPAGTRAVLDRTVRAHARTRD